MAVELLKKSNPFQSHLINSIRFFKEFLEQTTSVEYCQNDCLPTYQSLIKGFFPCQSCNLGLRGSKYISGSRGCVIASIEYRALSKALYFSGQQGSWTTGIAPGEEKQNRVSKRPKNDARKKNRPGSNLENKVDPITE